MKEVIKYAVPVVATLAVLYIMGQVGATAGIKAKILDTSKAA